MSPTAVSPGSPGPAARASLRRFRAGFWFGGFNGLTWMIGLGTPMVLLAEKLGASAFQVGLASSFVFLLLPVQVLSTAALRRLGYRRQMVLGWSLRALFLLVPLSLSLAAPVEPARWMPGLLVASVFGFCLLRAFGTAAHIPWMAAILPDEIRGRYFATDGAIVSTVGVGTLMSCAALFATLPGYRAFAIAYALALTGSGLAVFNLLRLPDAPPPGAPPLRRLHREARRLCLHPGPFRHYLLLSLLGSLVTSSLGAFTVYYLKVEAGLASSHILLFTAAQFAGAIAGSWAIRRTLDRFPVRRFFQASVLLVGAVDLYWLGLVSGGEALAPGLAAAYFVFGVATGVNNSTHFTYLPELSPVHERPVTIAVFTAVLGMLSGVAPMLWGLWLGEPGPEPAIDVQRFAGFFALGLALSALLAGLYGRLGDPRAHATGRSAAGVE